MTIPRALLLPPARGCGCLVAGALLLAAVRMLLALAAHLERQALTSVVMIGACQAGRRRHVGDRPPSVSLCRVRQLRALVGR